MVKRWGPPALNDVLFASQHPAATTRYWIRRKGSHDGSSYREEQKSSGIWIATPAGSTAAYRSAGGRRMPFTACRFAFKVRELYKEPGRRYRLTAKQLKKGDVLEIIPKMEEAEISIDGAHMTFLVKRGEMVLINLAPQPIKLL